MQGKKQYIEKLFLNFQLSERVPENNFYRRLREALDLSFLRESTKQYYGQEGQVSLDPEVFFKLILVGYLENLNSDRRIIEHARLRLDILYFIGYDIDEELPWHSTLSRTRQLYGEEVFLRLFKRVLSLCVSKGMVGGKRQALDSAYIKANASLDSLVEKEVLQDADDYTSELSANVDNQYKTVSEKKKKEVEQQQKWKEEKRKGKPVNKTYNQIDEQGNPIRPKFLSNHTHYSETDPEARISTKPGKPRQLTYSAQTTVDTKQHVITNIMADYSDKRDSESLAEVIEQTKENLEEQDLMLKEVLADSAYSSGSALQYLEENQITGFIPNHGQYKPERPGFRYNKEKDQYECQLGNKAILTLKRTAPNHQGYIMKTYRSSPKVCRQCPLRDICLGSKSQSKKLSDTIDKPFYDRMHQRLKSDYARRMKKLRSSIVEPVLGTLINFTGMRRIWTRGKRQANKVLLCAAIAYNLKKWLNYKSRKIKVISLAMEIEKLDQKKIANFILFLFRPLHQLYTITI